MTVRRVPKAEFLSPRFSTLSLERDRPYPSVHFGEDASASGLGASSKPSYETRNDNIEMRSSCIL